MPDPQHAADALRADEPFVCLLDADAGRRAAALEAVVQQIGPGARIIRTGNPLRAPLTLERLMIQAAGTEGTSPYDRSAAELTRILAGPGDPARVVLVIERAETLDREAVGVLREMSGTATPGMPRLQVLFAGDPSFRTLLEAAPAADPPVAAAPVVPEPVIATAPVAQPPSPAPAPELPPELPLEYMPLPVRERRPRVAWRVLLTLVLLAALAAAVFWIAAPDLAARLLAALRGWADRLRYGT